MTTMVAIFDNASDVDQAVTRLGRAGFEDTVFDEGIIAGEAHSLGLVFALGPLRQRCGRLPKPRAGETDEGFRLGENQITKLSSKLLSPIQPTITCPTKL